MIIKPYDDSVQLFKLEALGRRLLPTHIHFEKVQMDLRRKKRQVRGEREIEYPLSFLDEKEYLILHDVRLKDEQGYFQIDTLILSTGFGLILEIKNWYGTILFGENGQVIRIGDDEKEEGFPNPIPQAKLQQFRFQRWLHKLGFYDLPVKFLVVISFPSTIIKSIPPTKIPDKVIHNKQLFFQIQAFTNTNTKVNMKVLLDISKKLVKAHQTTEKDILKRYQISPVDISKGVFCPQCLHLPMQRLRQKWVCEQCEHKSVDAHIAALSDYKLLISPTITNSQARNYLNIESPHVMKRLLKHGEYEQIGKNKGRVYRL